MKKIIAYVGMDVHKNSFTLCTYLKEEDKTLFKTKIDSSILSILEYLKAIRKELEKENTIVEILCGYEAGCHGYSIKKELDKYDVNCVIMAPSTMLNINNKRVKTDRRDAENIARNLALNTYKEVQMVTSKDEEIKEYIRMRDDHKRALTKIKQQIKAFLLRHGKRYDRSDKNWTERYINWIRKVDLEEGLKEVLNEYLITYNDLTNKVERFDSVIEKTAEDERYKEKADKLKCFIGINTITAMSILSEVGDASRFKTAKHFSSFLGLSPGEHSSGDKVGRLSITKAGNSHIRRLLIEASKCYQRGQIGYKSRVLKKKQENQPSEIIAYADKANERLRRKFYTDIRHGKNHNIATTAVARELSCFIWGMLNNKITC